jgi:hypothetical protein
LASAADPWAPLPNRADPGALPALRVSASIEWNFFWSRGPQGERRLLLLHGQPLERRLPTLRGIAVTDTPATGSMWALTFTLTDAQLAEPFLQFCEDLVAATTEAENEDSAVRLTVQRAWRWHRLLDGASGSLLSEAEQKGLIGELRVLSMLLEELSPQDAVNSWRGPLGEPKDFHLANWAIEAKARQGTRRPHVTITSEDQLDTSAIEHLFLHVLEVFVVGEDSGATVTDFVLSTRFQLEELGGAEAIEEFDTRLSGLGFALSDDYSQWRWATGETHVYEVARDFPAIARSELSQGLMNVRYQIDLSALAPFERSDNALRNVCRGASRDER